MAASGPKAGIALAGIQFVRFSHFSADELLGNEPESDLSTSSCLTFY